MENLSSKYLAFKLSAASRQMLLDLYPPKFSRVICEHITVAFNVTEESFLKLSVQLSQAKLLIVGYATDDSSIECFAVAVDGQTQRPDGSTYHITHSLQQPAKPKDSNTLLKSKGYKPLNRFAPIQAELVLLNK